MHCGGIFGEKPGRNLRRRRSKGTCNASAFDCYNTAHCLPARAAVENFQGSRIREIRPSVMKSAKDPDHTAPFLLNQNIPCEFSFPIVDEEQVSWEGESPAVLRRPASRPCFSMAVRVSAQLELRPLHWRANPGNSLMPPRPPQPSGPCQAIPIKSSQRSFAGKTGKQTPVSTVPGK